MGGKRARHVWFFFDKSDHPLANLKSARELFELLDRAAPMGAIDEIDNWLESVSNDELLRPQRRIDLLVQLDNVGTRCARQLAWQYLNPNQGSRGQISKLWQVNRTYWRQLGDAYEKTLARFAEDDKAREDVRASLLSIQVRLLRAYLGCLKWDQFRYGPIDSELWRAAGRIYQAAAKLKQTEKLVDVGDGGFLSIASAYLTLLVFYAASMDRLLPLEIDLAERVIAHLLPFFSLTAQARPENVYWVDTAKPLPPTRLAKLPEISATLRFIATANALSKIKELQEEAFSKEQIPAALKLGNKFSLPTLIAVLKHLELFCAPQPPMRSHVRHHVKTKAIVVNGFLAASAALSNESVTGELWEIDDVSLGGMRANTALSGDDSLVIGSLVAMKPDGGNNWLLGIVKRISRSSQKLGSVGVETIGRAPRVFDLDINGMQERGVLLETGVAAGASELLVVTPGVWKDSRPPKLTFEGRRYLFRPLEEMRRGDDYVVGRYWVEAA